MTIFLVASVHPSIDIRERPFAFQINTADRVFYLAAESESQFNYWITGLVAFIKGTGTEKRLLLEQIESEGKAPPPASTSQSKLSKKKFTIIFLIYFFNFFTKIQQKH